MFSFRLASFGGGLKRADAAIRESLACSCRCCSHYSLWKIVGLRPLWLSSYCDRTIASPRAAMLCHLQDFHRSECWLRCFHYLQYNSSTRAELGFDFFDRDSHSISYFRPCCELARAYETSLALQKNLFQWAAVDAEFKCGFRSRRKSCLLCRFCCCEASLSSGPEWTISGF